MSNIQPKIRPPEDKGQDDRHIVVAYRPIAELKLDPRNPRTRAPKQIKQIAKSISVFGFTTPLLIDRHDKVIAGHGRIMACRQLGLTDVPTIRLDHLTEAQAKALMIADNRLSECSTWNDEFLAEQLRELSLLDLGFDLETIGFEMGEIDLRIEGISAEGGNDGDPADALNTIESVRK